jgi:hypothetical protein
MHEVTTWADQYRWGPRHEHSAYTHGRVRPDPSSGRWLAETGWGGTLRTLGVHPEPQAAEHTVRDALRQERDQLRRTLHASGIPELARIADAPWQEPSIPVWATQAKRMATPHARWITVSCPAG